MFYTIGEMAKKMGVPASTLRYYDKEGLLPFVGRSGGGIRVFRDEDIAFLEIIGCMKKTGMPIKEIKFFVDWCIEGDSTIDNRLALIENQKKLVEQQLSDMSEHLLMLEYKTWYYETAKKAGTCKIHDTIDKSEIPEKFHRFLKPKE